MKAFYNQQTHYFASERPLLASYQIYTTIPEILKSRTGIGHETRLKNTAFNGYDSNTLKVYLQYNQTILALKISVFQNVNRELLFFVAF